MFSVRGDGGEKCSEEEVENDLHGGEIGVRVGSAARCKKGWWGKGKGSGSGGSGKAGRVSTKGRICCRVGVPCGEVAPSCHASTATALRPLSERALTWGTTALVPRAAAGGCVVYRLCTVEVRVISDNSTCLCMRRRGRSLARKLARRATVL